MSGNGSYIDWQAWWACAQARFLRSGGHGSSVPLLRLLNGYTAAAAAIRKPIGAEEKRRFHRSLRPASTHGERFAAWWACARAKFLRSGGHGSSVPLLRLLNGYTAAAAVYPFNNLSNGREALRQGGLALA